MSEVYKSVYQINEAISKAYAKGESIRYLILPITHRQAIKIMFKSPDINIWDTIEPMEYLGIPIIKKEEVVILNE